MQISGVTRNRLLAAALLSFVFLPSAPRAHAVSKEIVELQTQVQQLLDQVQRLQSTLDTKMGVLQHLAEQTADEANQMTTAVTALQQKLNTQNDAAAGKLDAVSGQVQSLNDSVDELKARIAKLDKSVSDLQTQIQNMQAPPAQAQPGGTQPGAMPGAGSMPGAPGTAPAAQPAAQQAPPLQETLQAGERDFNAGRYDVALGEFQSVVQVYPLDDLAGTAQFYMGEIAYQQKDYPTAIKSYNALLEGFSGNAKAPAAQLHKGYALLAEDKKDEGIHELRSLIQRHPQTPEARAARSKLNGMGVKIAAH
jgi:tol-pal system protein YbgF